MADAVDVGQLRSVLECSVCLERYDNPKMLKCTHEFCKMCLEEIIEFRKDGSASILCPMRCSEKTILSKDSTVNDLTASYIAKNILETLKISNPDPNQQLPMCSFGDNCTKRISIFCCSNAMCTTCCSKHATSDGNHKKVNLAFNKRDSEVMVLCDKHVSMCTHVCQCKDSPLLCMYCLDRDRNHTHHAKVKIGAEVSLLREALAYEFSSHLDSIKSFANITQEKIDSSRESFCEAIKKRKEQCLKQYSDFLSKEEERLMDKFNKLAASHVNQYTANSVTEFYQNQLRKHDVELALMKNEILHKTNMDRSSAKLKKDTLRLTSASEFQSPQPLGDIDVESTEEVVLLINSTGWSTFTCSLGAEAKTLESSSTVPVATSDTDMADLLKLAKQCSLKSDTQPPVDLQALRTQGNDFFKKYMYDKAIECYSKAIQHCPKQNVTDLSVFYQNRAAAHEKLRRWPEVLGDCSKAIELDTRYCKALHRRARAYHKLGEEKACFQDAIAACMLDGCSNTQGVELAYTVTREVTITMAQELWDNRQFSLPSPNYIKCHLADFGTTDLIMINVTGNKSDATYSRILECMKKNDYENVLEMCTKEINANGKHKIRCTLIRGVLKDLMQDPGATASDFNFILKWYETSDAHDAGSLSVVIDALCRIAEMKHRVGAVSACFETLDTAFQLVPDNAKVFFHKARLLLMQGRRVEAILNFKKSVSMDPNFVVPRLRLAYCLGLSDSQGDIREAEKVFNETISRFPESAAAWCNYGRFLSEQKRFNEASQKFDRALEVDPTYMDAYDHKARLLHEDPVAAADILGRALEIDSRCHTIHVSLGRLEAELGHFDRAAGYYKKALTLVADQEDSRKICELLVIAEEHSKLVKKYGNLSTLNPHSRR